MKGAATPMFIDSPSGGPPPKLKRTIGLWMATALVVGNMIGSAAWRDCDRRPAATGRLYVGSEVGALRRVVLHRPDLELRRLTPANTDELLFDDVLWVGAPARSTTRSPMPCASAASRSSTCRSCWPRRSRSTA